MDDLFRFLQLRPALPVAPDDVQLLVPSFVDANADRATARDRARAFISSQDFVKAGGHLSFAVAASEVARGIGAGRVAASAVSDTVHAETGKSAAELSSEQAFIAEDRRIVDTLVAMKLMSDSSGGDAPGLSRLLQGYDAIARAGGGSDPVGLRALVLDGYEPAPVTVPAPPDHTSSPPSTNDARHHLAEIEATIAALDQITASAFVAEAAPAATPVTGTEPGGEIGPTAGGVAHRAAAGHGARAWLISPQATRSLPESVQKTLVAEGIDLGNQPLTVTLSRLHTRRLDLMGRLADVEVPVPSRLAKVGVAFAPIASRDYVGDPATPMPFGHGKIRPVGIGDLLMVKEHTLRYEGGELAHVENVLKSEHLSRQTRRLERTETTIMIEAETTREETRDTQTTERFSLRRETDDTIKTDTSTQAGVAVDAKYGPFVEVKANAGYTTSTATESAVKQAAEFSKDVVARSVSKLVERVLERRSVTTIKEFEETYTHGFDNTAGSGHISGFYQWIDKVLQAQVYNYGKRLLFDVTVPEPATNYILMQANAEAAHEPIDRPVPFTLTALQLHEGNYATWAQRYDATGVEAPPPPIKTVVKSFDAVVGQAPHSSSNSQSLAIDAGYQARYASFAYDYWAYSPARLGVLIGSNWMDAIGSPRLYLDMAGEVGAVAFAYEAYGVENLAATVEIFCTRTDEAYKAWLFKTHAAITQAYLAKQQAYEQAVEQARAAAGVAIAGQNPEFNRRIVASELQRQCLTLITGQQFDGFGALELSSDGYAQPQLERSDEQMPYVRFFQQAFEWERIVYFFYPYFWGWKPGWKNRIMLDDTDPAFGDFLRAGAARVVIPVRPGFEGAITHYLETSELWNGGPPPDLSSSLYVPITREIAEATGAPGDEAPIGEPWEVRVPTTLVRLRPNDDVPAWHKVGGSWEASN